MTNEEKISSLEDNIKRLEKDQHIEKDYSQKALSFVRFSVWFFLGLLSITGSVIGLILFLWSAQTAKEIKDQAKEKLSEVQSEEIFRNYKQEADKIIENLTHGIREEKIKKDLNVRREFYSSRGQSEKALETGEEIIRRFPKDPFSYYDQAEYYSMSGEFSHEQKVKSNLEKAFELGAEEIKPYFEFDSSFSGYKDKEWYKTLLKRNQ